MDIMKELWLAVCCLLLGMKSVSSGYLYLQPYNVSGTLEGEVRLNCTVDVHRNFGDGGTPDRAVRWFRGLNHEELGPGVANPNPRISTTTHVRYSGNTKEIVSELIIENLKLEDDTNYTCCKRDYQSCSDPNRRIYHQAYVKILPVSEDTTITTTTTITITSRPRTRTAASPSPAEIKYNDISNDALKGTDTTGKANRLDIMLNLILASAVVALLWQS
ncbi:uncharacterized protein [Diadema antillarum]|uniref:uncharacterized protein n=1 Tax=Diadema antillarum TaxID=105358 RepID=UPI003A86D5B9